MRGRAAASIATYTSPLGPTAGISPWFSASAGESDCQDEKASGDVEIGCAITMRTARGRPEVAFRRGDVDPSVIGTASPIDRHQFLVEVVPGGHGGEQQGSGQRNGRGSRG